MDLRSLEIKIARSENLPVLPQIVSQVLKLADDPEASARDMERIVERDSAITAKILRVANSSYYGLNQVPSVARAISMLGMNTIRSLVVGVAYQQVISGRQQATQFSKLEFWRHSLGVGTAARIIAKMRLPSKAEELYVAGLMHDVGLLAMERFHPVELDKSVSYAVEQGLKLHEAENIMFGFDHARLGLLLAEKWGLSQLVLDAIRFHHEPFADDRNGATTSIIALANELAHQSGLTNSVPAFPTEVDRELLDTVGLPIEQLDVIKNVMVLEIAKAEEAFQIS